MLNASETLVLPSWGQIKSIVNKFGRCHLDLSKNIAVLVGEQAAAIKKEYLSELEQLKKEKKRLVLLQSESLSYLKKANVEFESLDKDLKAQIVIFNDMSKKKEDP